MNDLEQRIVKLLPSRMKNCDGEVISSDLDDLICSIALVMHEELDSLKQCHEETVLFIEETKSRRNG